MYFHGWTGGSHWVSLGNQRKLIGSCPVADVLEGALWSFLSPSPSIFRWIQNTVDPLPHTHTYSCHKRAHVPNSMRTCVHSCMLMCTHACTLRSQTRLFKKKKNWSIVDLQCWNNFCCTAQWLSYAYICILFLIFFFIMIGPRRLDIIPRAIQ